MNFDFRKLVLTKTLAVTFVLLILLGNFMFVPRVFGGRVPDYIAALFNILIYLSIFQAIALVSIIIFKTYLSRSESDDEY